MKEIWKDIKNFEDCYQVSSLGRVKSLARTVKGPQGTRNVSERIISQYENRSGYLEVTLKNEPIRRTICVNKLMEVAFRNGKKCKHEDNDRTNNVLTNLVYDRRFVIMKGLRYWAKNDYGYTYDISGAKLFSEEKAKSILNRPNSDKTMIEV